VVYNWCLAHVRRCGIYICIPGPTFSSPAISSTASAFSVPHFLVLHFWSFKLDIIGLAFSGPGFSGPAFSARRFSLLNENLRKSYLADLQNTYENLTTNLGQILRKSYEVSKIGSLEGLDSIDKTCVLTHRSRTWYVIKYKIYSTVISLRYLKLETFLTNAFYQKNM